MDTIEMSLAVVKLYLLWDQLLSQELPGEQN
jgi:hypothetical protein